MNDQIWPEIGIFARPCWLIWCLVGGSVGGCGAGFISQDTYLLYDKDSLGIKKKIDVECFQDFDVNLENWTMKLTSFSARKSGPLLNTLSSCSPGHMRKNIDILCKGVKNKLLPMWTCLFLLEICATKWKQGHVLLNVSITYTHAKWNRQN